MVCEKGCSAGESAGGDRGKLGVDGVEQEKLMFFGMIVVKVVVLAV